MNLWIAIIIFAASLFLGIFLTVSQPVLSLITFPYLFLIRDRHLMPRGILGKYYVLPIFIWIIVDTAIIVLVAILTPYVIPLAIGFAIAFILVTRKKSRRDAVAEAIERLEKAGAINIDDVNEEFAGGFFIKKEGTDFHFYNKSDLEKDKSIK